MLLILLFGIKLLARLIIFKLKIALHMTFLITVHSYFVFVYERNLSEYSKTFSKN